MSEPIDTFFSFRAIYEFGRMQNFLHLKSLKSNRAISGKVHLERYSISETVSMGGIASANRIGSLHLNIDVTFTELLSSFVVPHNKGTWEWRDI